MISSAAKFSNESASVPSITYFISFLGKTYSSRSSFFSTESRPSFLDIIERSTKLLIKPFILYFLGKYANKINVKIFLNLSSPKPIIIAENVPPKTTSIGERRNKAEKDPPSMKNEPNIESIPNRRPDTVDAFRIISSPIGIYS